MKVIKKVKIAKDIKKHALESGAEVKSSNGQTFNTGGQVVDKKQLLPKAPLQPKPKEPEKPSAGDELLAKTIQESSASTREILESIQKQISAIQFNAAEPVTDWVFDIIRNNDEAMSIRQIKAKGSTPKRVLN